MARREGPEFRQSTSSKEGAQAQLVLRTERRSDVQLTLTVCGIAMTGKLFVEHCSTRNISESGCCIRLRTRPQADSALALRPLRWGLSRAKASSQLLFQVVWLRQDGDGWLIGAFSLGKAGLLASE